MQCLAAKAVSRLSNYESRRQTVRLVVTSAI
jgi:hypothetical protein